MSEHRIDDPVGRVDLSPQSHGSVVADHRIIVPEFGECRARLAADADNIFVLKINYWLTP